MAEGGALQRLVERFPMVNDHPDVAGVWRDAGLLADLGPLLAAPYRDSGVTKVVGPETRGMVLGAVVALELGCGLVCVRKGGTNHPGADIEVTSGPTWTADRRDFQLRSFDLSPGDTYIVVDDWITTGNSARATLVAGRRTGATCAGVAVIVSKAAETVLDELGVHALVSFDELMRRQSGGS